MLPRNKLLLFFTVSALICLFETTAFCDENALIKFYQEHISAVDGNRCPMHPTCSAYASEVFEKHGPVIGWIMALDRLVRCGRDEAAVASEYFVQEQTYIHDPVENNDSWWFSKEKAP